MDVRRVERGKETKRPYVDTSALLSILVQVKCDCKGDLGYAHKECLKKWVDEKRNNICEICGKRHANIEVTIRNPAYTQTIENWALAMSLAREGQFFNSPSEIWRVERLYARETFRKAIATGYVYVCF